MKKKITKTTQPPLNVKIPITTSTNGKESNAISPAEIPKLAKWLEKTNKPDFGKRWINTLDGNHKDVPWFELIQLRKDILWAFDENGPFMHSASLYDECFTLPYWEYACLSGDVHFDKRERNFYKEGGIILTIMQTVSYLHTRRYNPHPFGKTPLKEVQEYIEAFTPSNKRQKRLHEIASSGIAVAVFKEEKIYGEVDIEYLTIDFLCNLFWVRQACIEKYYKRYLKESVKLYMQ